MDRNAHGREDGASAAHGAVADDESTACSSVQDRRFDDECRAEAAVRLASACTLHPAGQAGVARQIGMTSPGAMKRFNRYCTGEKTAPIHVIEKIRQRCPRVFAAWMEGLRRDALHTPVAAPRLSTDEAVASIAKEAGEAVSALVLRRPKAVVLRELADVEETIADAKRAVEGGR